MGSEARRRASELVRALTVYKGLHNMGDVDLRYIRAVEEAQWEAAEALKDAVDASSSLAEALDRALGDGSLSRAAGVIASRLGLEAPEGDVKDVLARVLAGDLSPQGSKPLLLAVQALARLYAEKVLRARGEGAGVTVACPLCGALSETMYARRGSYYMVCHFCGYTWRVSTEVPLCPRCGASAPLDVGFFTDRSRRLALARCWRCGYTWRAILDEHVRAPLIALPVIALGAERFRGALEARGAGGEG